MRDLMIIYLSVYTVFAVWSFFEDFKKNLTILLLIELIGNLFLIIAALAYWSVTIRSFLNYGWRFVYFIGVALLIFFLIKKLRFDFEKKDYLYFDVMGALFVILACAPLLISGGFLLLEL